MHYLNTKYSIIKFYIQCRCCYILLPYNLDVRYLDGDDDETNDNLQTEIAQIHQNRDKMKKNRAVDKRNITSSNNRERNSRSRDRESDEDISDDDISDNGLDDSEYDDEEVDDSLSTKSSRIHNHRGRHQSSGRSNPRAVNDSTRPRSSVRNHSLFVFKPHCTLQIS